MCVCVCVLCVCVCVCVCACLVLVLVQFAFHTSYHKCVPSHLSRLQQGEEATDDELNVSSMKYTPLPQNTSSRQGRGTYMTYEIVDTVSIVLTNIVV